MFVCVFTLLIGVPSSNVVLRAYAAAAHNTKISYPPHLQIFFPSLSCPINITLVFHQHTPRFHHCFSLRQKSTLVQNSHTFQSNCKDEVFPISSSGIWPCCRCSGVVKYHQCGCSLDNHHHRVSRSADPSTFPSNSMVVESGLQVQQTYSVPCLFHIKQC